MTPARSPSRGEIWLVNFDPTIGSEIQKTRPALILQNDIANQHSPVTIVAALTSRFDNEMYPTEVHVPASEGGLSKDSTVLLNQLRTIDRQRLVKRLGRLKSETMVQVAHALTVSLGLVDLD
ncbi:MAG: type II toxin-antitoxin system PemK/MazF family toxin [Candidatus Sericytochromatia bacterium]